MEALTTVLGNDDLLISVLAHADIVALGTAAKVSRRFREASAAEVLWEPLCAQRWATKAKRYHLTPARRAELVAMGLGWKDQYKRHEEDGRRRWLKNEAELSSLTFDFRFRMSMQSVDSVRFRFEADGHVSGHPNGLTYDWTLTHPSLQHGPHQTVTLGQFPPARVERLPSWHWVVSNPNVVCCSAVEDYPRGTPASMLLPLDGQQEGRTAVTLPDGRVVMLPAHEYAQYAHVVQMLQQLDIPGQGPFYDSDGSCSNFGPSDDSDHASD